jgi:hypothetical protein
MDAVTTAVAMWLFGGWVVDDAIRGGVDNASHRCQYRDNNDDGRWYGDDKDNGWDLPPPHAMGEKVTDVVMLLSPLTNDQIDYIDEDGGRRQKRSYLICTLVIVHLIVHLV